MLGRWKPRSSAHGTLWYGLAARQPQISRHWHSTPHPCTSDVNPRISRGYEIDSKDLKAWASQRHARIRARRPKSLPAAITAIFSDDFTIAALKNLGIKSDIFIESIMDVSRSYMKLDYAPSDLALSFFTKARQLLELYVKQPALAYSEVPHEERADATPALLQDLRMLEAEPALASESLYVVAHRIWNSRDLAGPTKTSAIAMANYILQVALSMGNLKAALDLANIAHSEPDGTIPQHALQEIRTHALKRSDSRAITIYIRHLLRLGNLATADTRLQAYELALAVSKVIEPTIPGNEIQLTERARHVPESPWSLLRQVCFQRLELDHPDPADPTHQEIDSSMLSALRQGLEFGDSNSCKHLSNHHSIVKFSPEWIDLKTKSAMSGNSECAFDLAWYNLEYWGWFPCRGRPPSKNPESRLGFEWLELSAQSSISDAKSMYQRYLILALILRENGLLEEGHDAIRRGLLDIEQYSNDPLWRGWSLKQLQSHDRGWDSIKISVADLLGDEAEPQLLPDQRRQIP